MASPQRNFEPAPEPAPAPSLRLETLQSAPPNRPAFAWKRYALLSALLVAILAFWYIGFGWGDSGGWLWGARVMPETNDGQLNGSGVAILNVADKQEYIGQGFAIQNVAVDRRVSSNVLWIGSWHNSLPMLLILPSDHAPGSRAQPGQLLDVTGKIVRAPSPDQAKRQWNLSGDDLEQLQAEGVFIQAASVRQVKR